MGTVVPIQQSDKHLREKIEELDTCYALINDAVLNLYHLEMKTQELEDQYDKEFKRHIQCVGEENVAKDLFDYTVEENENRTAAAGGPGED